MLRLYYCVGRVREVSVLCFLQSISFPMSSVGCTFAFLTYKVSGGSVQAPSIPPQIPGSHAYEHRSLRYFPSIVICQLLPQRRSCGHVTDWKYPGLLKQINSWRRSIKSGPQKCLESKPPSEPGWMLLRGQNKRPYFLQSPQTKSSLSSQHA